MKKDLSEFTEAMTHEVSELTTAAKGGMIIVILSFCCYYS